MDEHDIMKSIMDTLIKPDNKYYTFLLLVAINAMVYSAGSPHSAFASTSVICIILIYFDRKTHELINRTLAREEGLLNTLEKVDFALSKMPVNEQANFRKILRDL